MSLGYIKAYAVPFGEGFETIPLNGGKVNEHIRSVVLCDETKTFCVVKPFYP